MKRINRIGTAALAMCLSLATSIAVTGVGTATTTGTAAADPAPASSFHGINWAADQDNFTWGPVIPVGLTTSPDSCDGATPSRVHDNASDIIGKLKQALPGINTIRFPINPTSVLDKDCDNATQTWWNSYQGAIDAATESGMRVIIGFWTRDKVQGLSGLAEDTNCHLMQGAFDTDHACFNTMWNTVVGKYANNPNVYFEPMNEPYAYPAAIWELYATAWVFGHSNVPRGRIVISGTGFNQDVTTVGGNPLLVGTLLSMHHYTFNPCTGSNGQSGIANCLGDYADRTIVDEFGDTMAPQPDTCGLSTPNYDAQITGGASGDLKYVHNTTEDLRARHVGSVYWPGLGGSGNGNPNGDGYRMLNITPKTSPPGTSHTLCTTNFAGVDRLEYAWGTTANGGIPCTGNGLANGTYLITNQNSKDAMDVPGGNPADGTPLDQWPVNNNSNQHWNLVALGCDLYSITSVATGKVVDISGAGQNYGAPVDENTDGWRGNQEFVIEPAGGAYAIASVRSVDPVNPTLNRLEPVEVPGFSTTAGTNLDQWGWNGGANQLWLINPPPS